MFLRLLRVAALCVAALAAPCHAAESYDNCAGFIDTVPATISAQGTWCLRHDLSTAITSGSAITVAANNVTVDCNDFKVGGLAAGTSTDTFGIVTVGRLNTTFRNCNVRGFQVGIFTNGGGGHLIEHNSLDGNTYAAMYVDSPNSTIRSNRVIDTGGSTRLMGTSFGIYALNGVDILDNTVNGVAATPIGGNSEAFGIYTESNGDASIAGNRVRGLVASGTPSAYGIYSVSSGRQVVRGNDVQGNGVVGSIGVRCDNNQATARDNAIAGFATGILNCLSTGNTINTN